MWEYLEYYGGYNECRGVILSTVGDAQYHGGYYEYPYEYPRGVQYHGRKSFVI